MESKHLFVAACFLFVLGMVILKIRYGPGSGLRKKAAAPEPDLPSGRILVTGWSAAETRRILADFAKMYDLAPDTVQLAAPAEGPQQITWTRPIDSDTAFYLVNYLHYPMKIALEGRNPEAVGVIAVPAGIAPKGLAPGTLAKIYVPEGDTEHDLVHALTGDGRAYRISFTRLKWEPIDAPRAPALVGKTAFKEAP
ncbi:MAG: hypothetical protein NBV68_02040 [Erythrobacter sp.]|uniref:hypothetical protein n=1 Tax=Erythrobacter sp. TaxID=1042 RepID=UPI0025D8D659|nr:hypothetical protein [Erythrobacter sp.]MCL9998138.1 hypothetical protein [Erythrobacter sp.]